MLTIGQLASYAGVTVKAVRHYHAKGLLAEPERDHSGYRRYGAAAVVDLIRIRTLAQAGVPLSRVRELLPADDEQFAVAIAEIDLRLRDEITERRRLRQRIAQLAAGDRLALPAEAVAYLDRLRTLDLPQRMIDAERDAWILVAAQLPDQMKSLMRRKQQQLDNPAVVGMYRELAVTLDWQPEDPRIADVADRIVAVFDSVSDAESDEAPRDEPEEISDDLAALLDAVFLDSVPIARQLLHAIERRGWSGWTKNERIGL